MIEFGRYHLSYEPPEGVVEAGFSTSISGEASLTQMLELFESFLKAAGYELGGKELCLEEIEPWELYPSDDEILFGNDFNEE